jgi:hypothetical protein
MIIFGLGARQMVDWSRLPWNRCGIPGLRTTQHGSCDQWNQERNTGTFTATGPMTAAGAWQTATLLSDGRVLLVGGSGASAASAELYNPKTGTFSATGSMMTTARIFQTAALLSDGRVLIAGGAKDMDTTVASADLYDPKTGMFTATGSMATARGSHTATLLSDGRVLVAGGSVAAGGVSGMFLASAELYNPKTGTFGPTGP